MQFSLVSYTEVTIGDGDQNLTQNKLSDSWPYPTIWVADLHCLRTAVYEMVTHKHTEYSKL